MSDSLNNEWRKVASTIYRKPALGAALDHRVVDAIHGGQLFKYIKQSVRNPNILQEKYKK